MALQHPTLEFEDIPLEDVRRMGRGPRMEPMLYDTLRQEIQSLSSEAVRIHLGPEITPTRMKHDLQHIARELNVPVTVRRIPGGLIFWRSTAEELQQTQQIAARLHTARQPPRGAHPRRRRRG